MTSEVRERTLTSSFMPSKSRPTVFLSKYLPIQDPEALCLGWQDSPVSDDLESTRLDQGDVVSPSRVREVYLLWAVEKARQESSGDPESTSTRDRLGHSDLSILAFAAR